jgi:hypothetical protein
MLAFALLVSSAAAAHGAERGTAIVIRIDDHVDVPSDILTIAQNEATRIFRAAGVPVEWTLRREAQPPGDAARNFTVVILNDPAAVAGKPVDFVESNVAGQAVRNAGRAYIYYRRVTFAAARHARHVGTVLGMVIAHELGHLLLPPNSHASAGIMRADLDFASRLPDEFMKSQGAAIRTALSKSVAAAR